MENNIIVTAFNIESEGYQALSELRQAAAGENHFVSSAALVKKEDGICTVLDGEEFRENMDILSANFIK